MENIKIKKKSKIFKFISTFLLAFTLVFVTNFNISFAAKSREEYEKDFNFSPKQIEKNPDIYNDAYRKSLTNAISNYDINDPGDMLRDLTNAKTAYENVTNNADGDDMIRKVIGDNANKFKDLSDLDREKLERAVDRSDYVAIKTAFQDNGILDMTNTDEDNTPADDNTSGGSGNINMPSASAQVDLGNVPEGSMLAHIYFSKTKASATTNDLTLALNEIASWRDGLSKANSESVAYYGHQTAPANNADDKNDRLAVLIRNLYKYDWISAKDSKDKNDNGGLLGKVKGFFGFLNNANLDVAMITSSAYLTLSEYIGKIFSWLGDFSIVNLLGFTGDNDNWFARVIGQSGLGNKLFTPAANFMYTLFCGIGAIYLAIKLRDGLKKSNFNKVRHWGWFMRALTILLTIPLSVKVFQLTSGAMNNIAVRAQENAATVNDSYFVDTLAWATAMNLDTSPIGGISDSDLEPTETNILRLNRAIRGRISGSMAEDADKAAGEDTKDTNTDLQLGLASAVYRYKKGEMATVEDYINGIASASSDAPYSARLMPELTQAYKVVAYGGEKTFKTGGIRPYFLATKGKEETAQPKKQEAKKPKEPDYDKIREEEVEKQKEKGKTDAEATQEAQKKVEEAKEKYEKDLAKYEEENDDADEDEDTSDDSSGDKKKFGYNIQLAKSNGNTKQITLTKDQKMVANPVMWNSPSTYIYGAQAVGSAAEEEVTKDNYILGKDTKQTYNPEKGTDGKFGGNAAAIAMVNMNAGTSHGLPGPLSTQSTAFLLQSTLKNDSLTYRGFNTTANKPGETKMVGSNGTEFLRYTMPAKDENDRNAKISKLNMQWTVSLVVAVVAIIAAIKTPLIGGIFQSMKGFFGGLFKGDVISLFQHLLWQICVSASLIFVEVGVLMGGTIGTMIIEMPFIGDIFGFIQKIPIVGVAATFALIYGLFKVFTFKVIKTSGLELNMIEAIVVVPYLMIQGFTARMDRWRPLIYGRSGMRTGRGGGFGLSNDLNDKVNTAKNAGRNAKSNLDALGTAAMGAVGGAVGAGVAKKVAGGKNAAGAAFNKLRGNTGDGDANVDAGLRYGGLKSKLNKAKTAANANRMTRFGLNKDGKPNLDKDGNLIGANGQVIGKPDLDKDGNLVTDENGNILDEKGNIIGTPIMDIDGNAMEDENGNPLYAGETQYYDEDGNLIEDPENYDSQLYNANGDEVDFADEEAEYYDEEGNLVDNPENYEDQLYDAEGNMVDYVDPDAMTYYDANGEIVDDPENYNGQLFNANRQAVDYTPEEQTYYDEDGNEIENPDDYKDKMYNIDGQEIDKDTKDIKYFDEDGELVDNPVEFGGQLYDSNHDKVNFNDDGNIDDLDKPIEEDYFDAQNNKIDNIDTYTGDVFDEDGNKLERDAEGNIIPFGKVDFDKDELSEEALRNSANIDEDIDGKEVDGEVINSGNIDGENIDGDHELTPEEEDLIKSQAKEHNNNVLRNLQHGNTGNTFGGDRAAGQGITTKDDISLPDGVIQLDSGDLVEAATGAAVVLSKNGKDYKLAKDEIKPSKADEVKDLKEVSNEELSENIKGSDIDVNGEFEKDLGTFKSGVSFDSKTEFDNLNKNIDLDNLSDEDLDRITVEEAGDINKLKTNVDSEPGESKVRLTGNKEVDGAIKSSMNTINPKYKFDKPSDEDFDIDSDGIIADSTGKIKANFGQMKKNVRKSMSDGINKVDTKDGKIKNSASKVKDAASKVKHSFDLTDEQQAEFAAKAASKPTFRDAFAQAGGAIKTGEFFTSDKYAKDLNKSQKDYKKNITNTTELANAVKQEYLRAFNEEQKEIINSVEKAYRNEAVNLKDARFKALKDYKHKRDNQNNLLNKLSISEKELSKYNDDKAILTENYQYEVDLVKNSKLKNADKKSELAKLKQSYGNKFKQVDRNYNLAKNKSDKLRKSFTKSKSSLVQSKNKVVTLDKQYKDAANKVKNFSSSGEKRRLQDALDKQRKQFIDNELLDKQKQVLKSASRKNRDKSKINTKETLNDFDARQEVRDILSGKTNKNKKSQKRKRNKNSKRKNK